VYHPNEEEKKDPKLYASNVRDLMLREGGFKPSESSLVECRAYIALLEGRKPPSNSQAARALGLQPNGLHAASKTAQLAHSTSEQEASSTSADKKLE
jgi:lysophosphatidylcholine acyltransferase/lyso-PAF acetyltransferase